MKKTNNNTRFKHKLKQARLAVVAVLAIITFAASVFVAAAQDAKVVRAAVSSG